MAHNSEKIFGEIRKLIAGSGPPPTKTAICQALITAGTVNSTGTAHKYVHAFFMADALKAEFRAPEVDAAELPSRVRTAYDALVTASGALRNEVAAALEDLARESSATFGKMVAAHAAAEQTEHGELIAELDRVHDEATALRTQLTEEIERRETIEADLAERLAALGEVTALADELRAGLAAEQAKAASLAAALDSKDKVVAALESERLIRDRRDAQAEQEIGTLRDQLRQLRNELEQTRLPEGAVVRPILPSRNSDGNAAPAAAT